MYVYQEKLAFIAHPRTASRAVRDALLAAGAEPCLGHHEVCHDTIKEIKDTGGTVLCTTRNMFDVLVSGDGPERTRRAVFAIMHGVFCPQPGKVRCPGITAIQSGPTDINVFQGQVVDELYPLTLRYVCTQVDTLVLIRAFRPTPLSSFVVSGRPGPS